MSKGEVQVFKNALSTTSRRVFITTAMVFVSAAIIFLIILSPFALAKLAQFKENWSEISNIGQTYGAVSALLSSLALGGVILSILLQAHNNQTAREETTRALHHDLIRMTMDNPELMTALGAPWGFPIPPESGPIRDHLYIQMWVSFLAGNFAIGELTEPAARYSAKRELFGSKAGRDYWAAVGRLQLEGTKGRRHKFFQILDEEYEKAISMDTPVAKPIKVSPKTSNNSCEARRYAQRLGLITSAAVIGALVHRMWRHAEP